MTSVRRDWILALTAPDAGPGEVEPACSPVAIGAATAVLGPGPVDWAVRTAREITEEIIERVPEHGGGPGPVAILGAAVESTVLLGLRGLLDDLESPIDGVSDEAVAAGAEHARRRVPLDRVLRGVRIGHARLHQALIAAVDALPDPVRREESQRVSDLLFHYADVHASRLAEEYLAERARWEAGRDAERRRVVEDLVAGKDVPAEAASTALGYELSRHHQAFVLVADDRRVTATDLRRCADHLSCALAPDGWVSVAVGPGELWAWAGWRAEPPSGRCRRARQSPKPGIRVAAGPVAFGPEGLRRSHLGAREAHRVTAATDPGWWCDYTDVRTLCLATADDEQARWYAEDVLGPLLADDERARELRETLRVYLACERSLRAAAERLHVARNTVTYRVRSAEHLLGHSLGDPMELRLALEIARALGPAPRSSR